MTAVATLPELVDGERKGRVARIVRDTGQRLLRFIRARVPSEPDAEDILQEVWQQLIVALDAGPIEQIGGWLYTVARNRIIDRYRKPKTVSLEALAAETDADDALSELIAPLVQDERTPRTESQRRMFWDQLHAALAELPEEQRQVFVWHELDGLSFAEIAALTGENLNTLLARKRYAVQRLRRRFAGLRGEFTL